MYLDKKQKSSPTKDNVGAFFQTCKVKKNIKMSLCARKKEIERSGSKIMGNWEIISNFI